MTVLDDLAGTVIDAAYQAFGRPPDPVGAYIAEVVKETDVPDYVRMMAGLSTEPRSRALWDRYQALCNPDAELVMEAGLRRLAARPDLPAEARRIIEDIAGFQDWEAELCDRLRQDADRRSAFEAGLDS